MINALYQVQNDDFTFLVELFHGDPAERPLKDLPLDVIYELTLGVAARIAHRHTTDGNTMSDEQLAQIAAACWQAIAL